MKNILFSASGIARPSLVVFPEERVAQSWQKDWSTRTPTEGDFWRGNDVIQM